MRPAGRGGSPGYPRCPGRCPGPDNSLCVSPIVFQRRGEPRWRGRRAAGGRGGRERPLESLPRSIRGAEGPCAPAEGGGLASIWRDEGYASKRGCFRFALLLRKIAVLATQRRTGRPGASVIFHLPLLSDLTRTSGWVSSLSLLPTPPGPWGTPL